MRYIEEDDCYCPSGVAERTQTSINTAWYFVLAGVILAVAKAAVTLINYLVVAVSKAAQGFIAVVDIVGWSVLCAVCFIVAALYVHDKAMNYIERRELPWYISGLVKIKRAIRGFFYRRDLQKRFDERPELSQLTWDDIMADMNDGHHEGEKPRSKEELADYLVQFYRIKDERAGEGRATRYDTETVSHSQAHQEQVPQRNTAGHGANRPHRQGVQ